MNFLLPALRRGWRGATKPLRLVRRARQVNRLLDDLVRCAERAEDAHRRLELVLADLCQRQERQAERLAEKFSQQLERVHQQQSNKLQLLGRLVGNLSPVDQLRLLYPWPQSRPALAPSERGWDGGGRDLVTRRLTERSVKVVLEIGTFLGLSTRAWLKAAPEVTAICVDPWFETFHDDSGIRDWLDLAGKNLFHLFQSSCWEYRDRIIPLRGCSPTALQVVADFGVQPDLVFIDGQHDYESAKADIETCHRLFPDAILTGDDWIWNSDPEVPFAVQVAVKEFAAARGWRVEARENTWAIER